MSAFTKGSPQSLGGTCIGQLWKPARGATAKYDKATVVRELINQGSGVIICVTDESMVELREVFDEIGFVSFAVDGGLMHHSISPSNIVEDEDKKVHEYLLEGYNKSIEEGRRPGEIREGDTIWYSMGNWRFNPTKPTRAVKNTGRGYRNGIVKKIRDDGNISEIYWPSNNQTWIERNYGLVSPMYCARVLREYK